MSSVQWWIAAVAGLILLLVSATSYLRAVGPHSRRKAEAQAQLDKKVGAGSGVPPDTAKDKKEKSDKFKWLKSNIATVLVVVIGASAVYWSFNASVRPADLGRWGYDKWLPLLIIWGVLAALIALNTEGMTTKTLHWVLAGVMIALLVVLPLWSWMASPSSGASRTTRSEIPLASSQQSEWPKLVIPAGGRSVEVPLPIGMVVKMSGNRFKLVNVYLDGSECRFGDNCQVGPPTRGVYALNEANETNVVSYAYAHR